jgi:hypothetical protein
LGDSVKVNFQPEPHRLKSAVAQVEKRLRLPQCNLSPAQKKRGLAAPDFETR